MRTLPPYTLLLLTVLVMINGSPTDITTYDQRQTGDLNIHVSVKDMRIVALLGGIGGLEDYDYNYDYSEMTVKPVNATTTAASTTTKKEEDDISTTTEKVVEITPSIAVLHAKPNTTLADKPAAINLNNLNSQKPSITILNKPGSTVNKPNLDPNNNKPHKPEINNNKNKTSLDVKPSNSEIPVEVMVTPVQIVHHKENEGPPKTNQTSDSIKKIRQADCIEGYRKDKRGVCRPAQFRRPTQPSLLKQIIQLSRRVQASKQKGNA